MPTPARLPVSRAVMTTGDNWSALCGYCGRALDEQGVSPDYCGELCQRAWQGWRARQAVLPPAQAQQVRRALTGVAAQFRQLGAAADRAVRGLPAARKVDQP